MTIPNTKESICEGYHTSFVMETILCNTGCTGAKVGFLLPPTSMSPHA